LRELRLPNHAFNFKTIKTYPVRISYAVISPSQYRDSAKGGNHCEEFDPVKVEMLFL
jgi:hypothetical protein